jgi:hypothetical protein
MNRRLGETQGRSERFKERKYLLPMPGIKPGFLGHPALSPVIKRSVEIMTLLITQFSSLSFQFLSLLSEYSPQHPLLSITVLPS